MNFGQFSFNTWVRYHVINIRLYVFLFVALDGNLECTTLKGWTALIFAVSSMCEASVLEYMSRGEVGADLNCKDPYDDNPLNTVVYYVNNDERKVKILLEAAKKRLSKDDFLKYYSNLVNDFNCV